jgi:hypothetical protein
VTTTEEKENKNHASKIEEFIMEKDKYMKEANTLTEKNLEGEILGMRRN